MERYSGSRWPKGIGLLSAGLLLASLLTFHPFDPTLTNLVQPGSGVKNALGLGGALLGGSLVEGLGAASLVLPLLIVNWAFNRRGRPGTGVYAFHGALLLIFAASLHGLVSADPLPSLAHAGLVGWAGGRWAEATTGIHGGAAILIAGTLCA